MTNSNAKSAPPKVDKNPAGPEQIAQIINARVAES